MNPEGIKSLRQRLGLTQPQLAELLGVDRNTVNRWEMGIRQPRGPAVKLLEQLTREAEKRKVK